MKPVYFGNKRANQITSDQVREDIKTSIKNIGTFNLTAKYYTFLNKKNVNNLKDNNYQVSLSTFGKKFTMYITTYQARRLCLFINKKNECILKVQMKFANEIFNGTLMDGELVKNENDKWIFLLNDIVYYKGNNMITMNFTDRQKVIQDLLENEYEYDENQGFFLSKKQYFSYSYIKDLTENYMERLNYKAAGLFFKHLNNFSDNYLFIFPECRSDSKILQNGVVIDDVKTNATKSIFMNVVKEKTQQEMEDDLFGDLQDESITETPKLEKQTCCFLINPTMMPDVYELYCRSNSNNIEKYSYAAVPDIETSQFLKELMKEILDNKDNIYTKVESGKAIYVECKYHKIFKKWIPFSKVERMDNIQTINQTQIILDSL